MAVVIPAWMEHVYRHDIARFVQFAVRVFGCEENKQNPEETAREGIACLRAFFRSIGMPTTFAEIGADPADIPAIVEHRAKKLNAFPFGGFVSIDREAMTEILNRAAQDE